MIKLFDDWVILVDEYNYTLAEQRGFRKDGRPEYKTYGYWGNLEDAIKGFRQQLIRSQLKQRDATLSEALRIIQESNAVIENLIKENAQ